jgi:hypothetical protein
MSKVILVNGTGQRLGVTLLSGSQLFVDAKSESKPVEIDEGTLNAIRLSSNLTIKDEAGSSVGSSDGDANFLALKEENASLKKAGDEQLATIAELESSVKTLKEENELIVIELSELKASKLADSDNANTKGKR